jgi:hypothetical protein
LERCIYLLTASENNRVAYDYRGMAVQVFDGSPLPAVYPGVWTWNFKTQSALLGSFYLPIPPFWDRNILEIFAPCLFHHCVSDIYNFSFDFAESHS